MIFYKKSVFYSIALLFSIATTLKSVFCRECESYSSYSSTSLCDDDFNDEKHHKVYIHDLEKIVKTQHIHTQLLQDVISILKKYLITANNGVTNQDIINAINALQRDINRVLKIENQTQDIVQAIYKEIQNVQSTVGEIPELQQSVAQISASQQVQTNMI
ncbi:MAG TPA: hypothetical protein VHA52_09735, partial [Candidatus Babeliaceae bacterium]|nr:hypothetical protein [Candidatus Babeliaceae bacterium]